MPFANNRRPSQEASKDRIAAMGKLEGQIYRRSLLVPVSTRLVFTAPPTSSTAPPGFLASDSANSAYLEFRTWVEERLQELRAMGPLGRKDADNHLNANIRRLEVQLTRLESILKWSWDQAKVTSQLPGYYPLRGVDRPELVPPRKCDLSRSRTFTTTEPVRMM